MKAVIYARVSSKEQEREGYSIPAQKKLLREYAVKQGFLVVKEFAESETAKVAGRKLFREMIEFLRNNSNVKNILVEKTDRLYRNFRDYVDLDFEQMNLRIHLVKESEILEADSKSHQKFIHGIKVLMAKNYSDNLSEEVKKGQLEKASQGIWPSSAPVGYKNKLDDHTIIPDPQNAPLIKKAFELAATRQYSLRFLKKTLYKDGLMGRRSRKELSKQSMARILRNPIYYGIFVWNGETYKGKHKPIISKQLYDKVQEAMGFVQKPSMAKHYFSYSGLIKCGHCGCAITAEKHRKKSGKVYIYYRCTNGKGKCENVVYLREEVIENTFALALKAIRLDSKILEWTKEALLQSLNEEQEYHKTAIVKLNARYLKLQSYIDQSYEDKLEGRIDTEMWKRKTAKWRKEQVEIRIQIEAHEKANTNYFLEGIRLMELSSKASELFRKMTPQEKRKVINSVLLNPTIFNGSIEYNYKKPFDLFVNVVDLKKWRG